MQPHNNNNNGATASEHSRDPYITGLFRSDSREDARYYSEAMSAVMDEMHGTATSRRAMLYNALR